MRYIVVEDSINNSAVINLDSVESFYIDDYNTSKRLTIQTANGTYIELIYDDTTAVSKIKSAIIDLITRKGDNVITITNKGDIV
jgi:hypothetical protein